MYLKHFAFTHYPFDHILEPDALFPSAEQAEAESRLRHLIELRGIGLLTGESGSGKTTLCRRLTESLHPGLYRVLYVPLSTGNVMDMYKCVAWNLGLPTERNRAAAFRAIRAELSRLLIEGKQLPLPVIDEAQYLRNDVLEDLRLPTNDEMDSENRLCMLFVGLTELRRRLQMSVHESLDQRIVVRYQLPGLAREELPDDLTHRLRQVSCELPLFEPAAIEAIHQATHGLPRRINRLAHCALVAAAAGKQHNVSAEHVQQALTETDP
ncbi:MAG: AAA family ATPase [Gammaproteobacteria bacterium]|nr:MAG: AAA family ATPase [Gammaproteobacteria bacterium]